MKADGRGLRLHCGGDAAYFAESSAKGATASEGGSSIGYEG